MKDVNNSGQYHQRLHQMDALRILLCVNIVYFHILHDNIMNFIGDNNIYEVLKDHSKDAQWAVEFFFLISGYFLYCSKTGLFWRYLITMIELFCAGYLVKCYLFLNSYSVMLMVLVSEILLIIFLTRGGDWEGY